MKSLPNNHDRPRPRRARRVLRRGLRTALSLSLVWGAMSSLDASRAWALQGGEDPATLPVLIDKRYGNAGTLTVHLQFSTPITSKFVESTGIVGGVDYGLLDWLSVGVVGGFFDGAEADIVDTVRTTLGAAPLTDLDQMTWLAGLDVTFTPIYGRISFASEYNPAFDVLAFVGGGLMGTRRNLLGVESGQTEDGTTGYGNFGLGFRFHVLDNLAIRTEYRQIIYPDSDIPQSEQNVTTGDATDFGGGISTAQQFQVGVQGRFRLF